MTHNVVQQFSLNQSMASPAFGSIAREHLVLLNMKDRVSEIFESFYNADERMVFNSRLKSFLWGPVVDNIDASTTINFMGNHEHGNQYNACQMTKALKLSKNNRVCLGESFDLFHGIEIPCVDPQTDIESVTLSVGLPMPSQAELSRMTSDENGLGTDRFNYLFYSPANKDNAKILYFPIKTITGLKSRYVQFFDCPVMLNTDGCNLSYSVEVKYTHSHLAPVGHQVVQLHYSKLKEYLRTNIRLTHNVFLNSQNKIHIN